MVIQAGKGRTALTYDVRLFGSDLLISVFGGVAHIGSVAVGDCGSLLSYTAKEHKDDAISAAVWLQQDFILMILSKRKSALCWKLM